MQHMKPTSRSIGIQAPSGPCVRVQIVEPDRETFGNRIPRTVLYLKQAQDLQRAIMSVPLGRLSGAWPCDGDRSGVLASPRKRRDRPDRSRTDSLPGAGYAGSKGYCESNRHLITAQRDDSLRMCSSTFGPTDALRQQVEMLRCDPSNLPFAARAQSSAR
jgi:hypothetical protein